MENNRVLKIKTVGDLDLTKYNENRGTANPYYRKFGTRTKSYFSVVGLSD